MRPSWPELPREPFLAGQTPLVRAPRLTAALGGPEIWFKRDDLTPVALGGNKVRKLEYLIADALTKPVDVVVTVGAAQSNHCVQTAAACNRVGLDCVVVLRGEPGTAIAGNILADRLLGAEVRFVPMDMDERNEVAAGVVEELRAAGRSPYLVPVGGSNGLGVIGYAQALFELVEQAEALGLAPTAVLAASGSGGTQAGLVLAAAALGAPFAIHGISVRADAATLAARVASLANAGAALVGGPRIAEDTVRVHDGYVGPGYGELTDASLEAIHLVAETEGILLDPVYTGKAMSGLIGEVRAGRWGPGDRLVFIHTGGSPALFAYGERVLAPSVAAVAAG
jgi:D-cysteine desulfhydrase family pyridoxal phosphate-dependent enzyme